MIIQVTREQVNIHILLMMTLVLKQVVNQVKIVKVVYIVKEMLS